MSLTPEQIEKRLRKLFLDIFPTLTPGEVAEANTENVAGWDSLATLTVFMAVESEFSVKLGYDKIQDTKSYSDIRRLIAN
jgi:acyl carrier protein